MDGINIQVMATQGDCSSFTDEKGKVATVSIVIAPLKVLQEGGAKLQIISGCNMFESCHNKKCWYSVESRRKNKETVS